MSHRPKQPMFLSRKYLRISHHKTTHEHRSGGIAQRYGPWVRRMRRARSNTRWSFNKGWLPEVAR